MTAKHERPVHAWFCYFRPMRSFFQRLLLGCLGLCSFASLNAQIVLSNAQTPAALVQSVLLGPGVTVSNITFNGVPANTITEQVGSFNGVNTTLGMAQGLILATGDVMNAAGPNNSGSSSMGGGNFGQGDPDLAVLSSPQTVNDAAVLEFDFVPNGDSLKFDFVFGSDEYLEFVTA